MGDAHALDAAILEHRLRLVRSVGPMDSTRHSSQVVPRSMPLIFSGRMWAPCVEKVPGGRCT